jgi:DNA topoisomerase-1
VYVDERGRHLKNPDELRRIRSLVLPPAWTDVWISADPDSHLQAVGRDARGRKQYRYHPEYRRVRDQSKFGRMLAFGAALPDIRRTVDRHLALPTMSKHKVLATVVRLLETTCIRVGNEEYARENDSYGLTTLKDKHVQINGATVKFKFRGKSGRMHEVELTDRRLARIVKNCRDIPGYELFQYLDEQGNHCRISSTDVNEYLREISGQDFTAKDFRTWGGTGQAALALEEIGPASSENEAKKNIVAAIKRVAERLGNRPATCRKYYVHPAVLQAYQDGSLMAALAAAKGDRREEACVMQLVEKYVADLSTNKKKTKSLSQQLRESVKKLS